ncbi:hypothetical protein CEXT_578911 [Caerostris extrusa]|uniref:Uncharacterized protein n=1 Tax=Caerostris extrusa TaxID=172846 RepID=A0AAV4N736_CAEEX|nr:hypothetical protein CEXT_578911 [Caerostris extrusa]
MKLIDGALERIEGIIQRNKEDECVIPSPCLKQTAITRKVGKKVLAKNSSGNDEPKASRDCKGIRDKSVVLTLC